MPKPRAPLSETIELSYPGLLDGKEYGVAGGLQRFTIPDPSWKPVATFDENPPIEPVKIPTLTFVRRPHSRIFELEKKSNGPA